MTNATKTLSLLFAGSVLLALLTSWGWSSSSSAAFQEELLAVDTAQVQAVHIDRSDGSSLRLRRADNGWTVTPNDGSEKYSASPQAIDRLFSTLPSLRVNAVATRQPEKHARYGVDSTGTRVTLLDADDEPLGQLYVGQTQMQRPQSGGSRQQLRRQQRGSLITYVRPDGQPDVYSVEAPLRSVVGRPLTDWRDKQIWAVDRSKIRRIEFDYPADSSFTITRLAPSDTASTATPDSWISEEDTLDAGAVSPLLRTLASPRASGFINDLSPDTFGDAPYTIRLHLADDTQRTLRLRPAEESDNYAATAETYPYVVELNASQWDRSVLQGRDELLTEDE